MLWEELTTPKFEEAAKECGGVCVLPIGVLEKHANHLPLGTDMYTAQMVCKAAAEVEPAIVFPYYFMGQIAEGRHYPGAVCVSSKLMMENLLAMCDEISRNGLKKILIVNSHGGNHYFLPYFAMEMPRLDRDYQVYIGAVYNHTPQQIEAIAEAAGTKDFGAHAGLTETSLMLHLRKDLVQMDAQTPDEGKSLERLKEVRQRGLFTGSNWYAEYPAHYAGDHTNATPQLGEMIFNFMVENVAKDIKAVKTDKESAQLVNEYAAYGQAPAAGVRHI